jgi:di/tricarboxylate transporter
LLDFAPIGLPLVVIGILYMTFWGRKQIHTAPPDEQYQAMYRNEESLIAVYRLGERLSMIRIPYGSPIAGVSLEKSQLRQKFNLNVIAIQHNHAFISAPSPATNLKVGDILVVEAKPQTNDLDVYSETFEWLPLPDSWDESGLISNDVVFVETVLKPRSAMVGETLCGLHFREIYGMNVIAIWRMGRPLRTGLSDIPLQFGDALLLQGSREKLPLLNASPEMIVLSREEQLIETPRKAKSLLAGAIMLATLVITATGRFSIGEVMLGGAVSMILSGILSMEQAYHAIEWKSIILVAGMLPLGIAMTKTGAAASLGSILESLPWITNPVFLLTLLVLAAVLLTQVMNGASVAAVMTPIAIVSAQNLGMNPRTMAMGVALATSMAFITPLGHPVNILVMSPGGYRFRDFFIVGLPLTILLFVFVVVFLPILFP